MNHFSQSDNTEPAGDDSCSRLVLEAFGDLDRHQIIELIEEARRIRSRRPFLLESHGHKPLFQPTLEG
jgi:hypothetical protein